jgi:hypothetical protein
MGDIMKAIIVAALVVFAIYLFFLMISSIDFSGMSFSEIKLIISICAGVAVSVFSSAKGVNLIQSALTGFVTGAIIYALILWFIEYVV